jgi:hypothetical protein
MIAKEELAFPGVRAASDKLLSSVGHYALQELGATIHRPGQ